jgi:PAS domain S-box-containing protein
MLDRIAYSLETLTGQPGITDDEFEGVAITDQDGVLVSVSPSVRSLLGFDYEALGGRSGCEFLSKDSRYNLRSFMKEAIQSFETTKRYRCKCRDANGAWHRIEFVARRLPLKGTPLMAFSWREIRPRNFGHQTSSAF